jgi:hypothetical protein
VPDVVCERGWALTEAGDESREQRAESFGSLDDTLRGAFYAVSSRGLHPTVYGAKLEGDRHRAGTS